MPGLFFFFDGTGVWNQGFELAKQVLFYLSYTSSAFCSGYFGDGGLSNYLPRLPCTWILLILASQVGVSYWHLVNYFIYFLLKVKPTSWHILCKHSTAVSPLAWLFLTENSILSLRYFLGVLTRCCDKLNIKCFVWRFVKASCQCNLL
jgi:hypothetical protein